MGIDPRFINAMNTDGKTALRLQFDLLLTQICSWEGLIVLSRKELAERLGTSVTRINLFISQAKAQGEIFEEEGELYFTRYFEYDRSIDERENRYVRHYKFLLSDRFKGLSVMAQRIILDILSSRFYLYPNRVYKKKLSALYHKFQYINGKKTMVSPGRFNVYSKQELLKYLEEIEPFFDVKLRKNRKGEEYIIISKFKRDMNEENKHNEGKRIWVLQRLEDFGYFADEVDAKAVDILVMIMDNYCKDLGFESAQMIFLRSLEYFVKAEDKLQWLYNLETETQKREMRKYFNSLMSDIEMQYAEHIFRRATVLELNEDRNRNIPEFSRLLNKVNKQIVRLEERWIWRFTNYRDRFKESFEKNIKLISFCKHYMKKFVQSIEHRSKQDPKQESFPFHNWLEEKV